MDSLKWSNQLDGERVILRRPTEADAEKMFRTIDSDRQRLREFLPWVAAINCVKEELKFIQNVNKQWEEEKAFTYMMIHRKTDEHIGNVGANMVNWEYSSCELGYWLHGKYEKKGLMSEAIRLLEKYIFSLGLNRIEIRCDEKNKRSSNVTKRCGYFYEGTLRQNILYGDKFRNTLVFSKLWQDDLCSEDDCRGLL